MYPKWLVFVLTLLSCMFLMASAAPVAAGDVAPVKRLKQFQARRPSEDGIVARAVTPADLAKRTRPSPVNVAKRSRPSPANLAKRTRPSNVPSK